MYSWIKERNFSQQREREKEKRLYGRFQFLPRDLKKFQCLNHIFDTYVPGPHWVVYGTEYWNSGGKNKKGRKIG